MIQIILFNIISKNMMKIILKIYTNKYTMKLFCDIYPISCRVSVNISSQNSSKLTPNGKCRACSLVLIKVFAEIKGERKRVHFGP